MKKILFNDKFGLTKAVLEGRKTITRRLIPQKVIDAYYDYEDAYCSINFGGVSAYSMTEFLCGCSRYQVGEVVSIAQNYNDVLEEWKKGYGQGVFLSPKDKAGMTNKMFVRADDMPHHIKITNIRVERLQDISDEDCWREGIYKKKLEYTPSGYNPNRMYYTFDGIGYCFNDARDAFAALIDKVSGKGTWDSNPLVWVYEFELVD